MEQTRKIELARLHYDYTWDTVLVKIPATTPDEDIFKVAVDAAIPEYGDGMYCIYCTYDDELPETEIEI